MKLFLILLIFPLFLYSQYITEPIFNEPTYIQTYGDKNNEAIVFVHGLGDDASTIWDETIEALKDDYYILTFDLPGFGKSNKSNQLYSPEKYAMFINTLIDNFVDKPFHLVGHSMGASISLKYASLYEERLKSLMLIDAAGILNKITYSKFLVKNKAQESVGTNAFSRFVSNLPQTLERVLPLDLDLVLNYKTSRKILLRSSPSKIAATALVQEDFSQIPRVLDVNTLILWGEDDPIAPLRTGYVLHKLIQNSRLEILANVKHVPIREAFEQYLASLKKHLTARPYIKEQQSFLGNKKHVLLDGKNDKVLTGSIESLSINNSQNIVIKDAYIENINITNSTVKILNSTLDLSEKNFIVESEVELTSSDMKLQNGIDVYDSYIDLAGVEIAGNTYIFKNLNQSNEQEINFSLSRINGNNEHGIKEIEKKKILYK